eukprot:6480189-Amphidinium_carterae.1
MADRVNWIPTPGGWRQGDQCFSWSDADDKVKWDSGFNLRKEVAEARPDFQCLDSGLAAQTLRQLELNRQSQKDIAKPALDAALGGGWHEVCVHSVFEAGELCVRCGEAVEDLEHIVHHCPAWAVEKREVVLATVRGARGVQAEKTCERSQWCGFLPSRFRSWA